MLDPARILAAAGEVLDLSRPVGLTSIALLHYVTDADDAHGTMARLVGALPSGSCLAITHGTHDLVSPTGGSAWNGCGRRAR